MSKEVDKAIRKRIRELKIDVTYSKKGHYNAAAIWNVVHYALGILVAIISTFVGAKNHTLGTQTIAFLSLLVAALGAIITFLKPQEKATQHKQAGDDFDDLLQQIATFQDVDMLQSNDAQHTAELKELASKKTKLNKTSLPIPRLAYLKAKKGLDEGEADYTEII